MYIQQHLVMMTSAAFMPALAIEPMQEDSLPHRIASSHTDLCSTSSSLTYCHKYKTRREIATYFYTLLLMHRPAVLIFRGHLPIALGALALLFHQGSGPRGLSRPPARQDDGALNHLEQIHFSPLTTLSAACNEAGSSLPSSRRDLQVHTPS